MDFSNLVLAEQVSMRRYGLPPRKVPAVLMDTFDATLFEVAAASAYMSLEGTSHVEFLHGANPDLLVDHEIGRMYVECKRFDRMTDATMTIRNEMRARLDGIPRRLYRMRRSGVVEVTVSGDPDLVDPDEVAEAAEQAAVSGGVVLFSQGTVAAQLLPDAVLENLQLYPSPQWYSERYGFQNKDEWNGIVVSMEMNQVGPSFLDEVSWDVGVKWRVTNEGVIWRKRRLGFSRLFKGLRQLAKTEGVTALHVAYEREGGVGHRRDELVSFIDSVNAGVKNSKAVAPDIFLFNELDPDVSVGGHFDFVEYAHFLSPSVGTPPVTTVFVPPEDWKSDDGEWGVGPDLPSIDDE